MNRAEMRRKAREQENRTCKTCKDNDNGLCDRKRYWQKMITAAENGSLTGKNGECEEYETD